MITDPVSVLSSTPTHAIPRPVGRSRELAQALVVRLAERCALPALVDEHVRLPASKDGTGAFPAAKLMSLVGGMVAGADSIDDMDRLRHGGLPRLFSGVRAPSTLGSYLCSFSHGHVKQLHAVARRFLPELAAHTPLLPGADPIPDQRKHRHQVRNDNSV